MIPNIGICWTWWSLHGFHSNQPAGRMCGRRLMNINLPRSISSGCHFNVLMSWMRLGLFNNAHCGDHVWCYAVYKSESPWLLLWVLFLSSLLIHHFAEGTLVPDCHYFGKETERHAKHFWIFWWPNSWIFLSSRTTCQCAFEGRPRRCWDANCLRPHRIILEIDRSELGEMADSCLIFCSFVSGGDGLFIFKSTFECSSPLLL